MKEAGVRQGPTLAGVWGRRRLPRPRRVRAGAQVVATPASSPSPIPTGVQIDHSAKLVTEQLPRPPGASEGPGLRPWKPGPGQEASGFPSVRRGHGPVG